MNNNLLKFMKNTKKIMKNTIKWFKKFLILIIKIKKFIIHIFKKLFNIVLYLNSLLIRPLKWYFSQLQKYLFLIITFLFLLLWYKVILWIDYSKISSTQIENYIKKEIIFWENYFFDKKLIDFKWYWKKDIFISIQSHWFENSDKIYIFSEAQSNPIQKFLYDTKIYSKDFTFNIPKNLRFNDFFLYNEKSSNIWIIQLVNFEKNEFYYGIISYEFWEYKIEPLFHEWIVDWCFVQKYWEIHEFCQFWTSNIDIWNAKFTTLNFNNLYLDFDYDVLYYSNKLITNITNSWSIKENKDIFENQLHLYVKRKKCEKNICYSSYNCDIIRWKLSCYYMDSVTSTNSLITNFLLLLKTRKVQKKNELYLQNQIKALKKETKN